MTGAQVFSSSSPQRAGWRDGKRQPARHVPTRTVTTASSWDAGEVVGLVQNMMRLAAPAHLLTGFMLALFGTYILIALQVA